MVYLNQIRLADGGFGLTKYGIEENRAFLRRLFDSTELENACKWFDLLDARKSFARQRDESMTLDNFLNLFDSKLFATLQLGSPYSTEIRYGAIVGVGDISKFAFVEMPYSEVNFSVVSDCFSSVFGIELESVPIAGGI